MTTLTVQVEADQDNGSRQWDSGLSQWSFTQTNPTMIGSENEMGSATLTTCFFRFLGVDIPSTATINSAKLQFKLNSNYSYSSKSCRIYAEDIASSLVIDTDTKLTDAQADKTTNYATWNLASSSSSSFLDSADFTDVIDELINVSGWDAGDNDVTILLMNPTEADMMSSWVMNIKAHTSGDGSDAVKLVIDYTEASSAVSNPAFLLFMD